MISVGLKTLKNKLSEFVRLAASGEVVLITDRNSVVAELGPVKSGRSESATDAVLIGLVRDGLLSPPVSQSTPLPKRSPVIPLEDLLAELSEVRSDR